MALFGSSKDNSGLLAELLASAGIAWWSLDIASQEFQASDNLRLWLGKSQFSGLKDYLEVLTEQDRSLISARLQAQAANKEPFSLEHTLVASTGTRRFVRLQVHVQLGAGGKITRLDGVVNDLTFERGERQLLHQVREASQALDSGILLLDAALRPIWANPAFTALTGYLLADFSGLNPLELLQGPSLTEELRTALLQDLADGDAFNKELQLVTKYGDSTWLQLDAAPQSDYEGKLQGYVLLVKDINALKQQQGEILQQKAVIEEKNQDILDSITHARRIQAALLPAPELINKWLPNSFVFYRPKDIVSGDFYYAYPYNDYLVFAAIDCTGHGVPGALMSALGRTSLDEVLRDLDLAGIEKPDPADILKRLDRRLRTFLGQDNEHQDIKDGMDVCLTILKPLPSGGYEVSYAGANRPLWVVSRGELHEYAPVKLPVGGGSVDQEKGFATQHLILDKSDSMYLFTDGIVDQFGGPHHRKYSSKQLKQLLIDTAPLGCREQCNHIAKAFHDWMGDLPQLDDVLLLGVIA